MGRGRFGPGQAAIVTVIVQPVTQKESCQSRLLLTVLCAILGDGAEHSRMVSFPDLPANVRDNRNAAIYLDISGVGAFGNEVGRVLRDLLW
jgi:hypothetical protein